MFWTRPHEHTVDVLHLHRGGSSYGAPHSANVDLRVHFAIRVLNDPFPAIALNGPTSDPTRTRASRYHLSFNARSGDMLERCIDDLTRFARDEGEPWFTQFRDPRALLDDSLSPLGDEGREALAAAMRGDSDPGRLMASRKLLGIPAAGPP